MLEKDIRNNSAWHHRFFVIFERPGARVGEGEVRRELRYVTFYLSFPATWLWRCVPFVLNTGPRRGRHQEYDDRGKEGTR